MNELNGEVMQTHLNVRTVYKFRSPSDQVKENLANGQLWFSLPKELNDPFDCKIHSYLLFEKLSKTPFNERNAMLFASFYWS